MKRTMVVWFGLFVCFSLQLPGQVPLEITEAELAIPFGSVDGRLILVGDYLIFLDQRTNSAILSQSRKTKFKKLRYGSKQS